MIRIIRITALIMNLEVRKSYVEIISSSDTHSDTLTDLHTIQDCELNNIKLYYAI